MKRATNEPAIGRPGAAADRNGRPMRRPEPPPRRGSGGRPRDGRARAVDARARASRLRPLRPHEGGRIYGHDHGHRLRQSALVPAFRCSRRRRQDHRDALRDARRDAAAPLGLVARDVRGRRAGDSLRLRPSRRPGLVLSRGHQDRRRAGHQSQRSVRARNLDGSIQAAAAAARRASPTSRATGRRSST